MLEGLQHGGKLIAHSCLFSKAVFSDDFKAQAVAMAPIAFDYLSTLYFFPCIKNHISLSY